MSYFCLILRRIEVKDRERKEKKKVKPIKAGITSLEESGTRQRGGGRGEDGGRHDAGGGRDYFKV